MTLRHISAYTIAKDVTVSGRHLSDHIESTLKAKDRTNGTVDRCRDTRHSEHKNEMVIHTNDVKSKPEEEKDIVTG